MIFTSKFPFIQRSEPKEESMLEVISNERYWGNGSDRNTIAGIAVNEAKALTLPAVFCALAQIAETIGYLPLNLMRDTEQGRVKAKDNNLFNILRIEANEDQTAIDFKSSMTADCLLSGNAYAYIDRDAYSGEVVGLYQLYSSKMKVKKDANNRTYYEYTKEHEKKTYVPDLIFHLKGFGTGGLLGMSPVLQCSESIGNALALQQFASSWFGNGAWAGSTITLPPIAKGATREQIEALKTQVQEQFTGSAKANRPFIAENGQEYKKTDVSPQQSQALESRVFSVQDIARAFRIPPHILMDLTNSTSSNIESFSLQFKQALLPWTERWCQAISQRLLLPSEKQDLYADFNFEKMIQVDAKTRFDIYNIGRLGGIFSANEVRAKENMDRLPGIEGDVYLSPLNYAPSDLIHEVYAKNTGKLIDTFADNKIKKVQEEQK